MIKVKNTNAVVKAIYNRISKGDMTIEQVPEIYKAEVQELLDNEVNDNG
jgi:hypothetical protein